MVQIVTEVGKLSRTQPLFKGFPEKVSFTIMAVYTITI